MNPLRHFRIVLWALTKSAPPRKSSIRCVLHHRLRVLHLVYFCAVALGVVSRRAHTRRLERAALQQHRMQAGVPAGQTPKISVAQPHSRREGTNNSLTHESTPGRGNASCTQHAGAPAHTPTRLAIRAASGSARRCPPHCTGERRRSLLIEVGVEGVRIRQ